MQNVMILKISIPTILPNRMNFFTLPTMTLQKNHSQHLLQLVPTLHPPQT